MPFRFQNLNIRSDKDLFIPMQFIKCQEINPCSKPQYKGLLERCRKDLHCLTFKILSSLYKTDNERYFLAQGFMAQGHARRFIERQRCPQSCVPEQHVLSCLALYTEWELKCVKTVERV